MTDPLTAALLLFDVQPDGLWKCGACGKLFSKAEYARHVLTHRTDETPDASAERK
jgi:ribosomal protein L37AE/L43A